MVLMNELKKCLKNKMLWLVVIIPLGIAALLWMDFNIRYDSYLIYLMDQLGLNQWQLLFKEQRILFFKEFLPVFSALILIEVLNMEVKNGGWRLLLTMPKKRNEIYYSKFLISVVYLSIMLLFNAIGLLIVGVVFGFDVKVGIPMILKMFLLQWISNVAVVALAFAIYWFTKKSLNVIWLFVIVCFLSQNLYYSTSSLSQYNFFSFSSIADGLIPYHLGYYIGISIVVLLVTYGIGYLTFRRKDF